MGEQRGIAHAGGLLPLGFHPTLASRRDGLPPVSALPSRWVGQKGSILGEESPLSAAPTAKYGFYLLSPRGRDGEGPIPPSPPSPLLSRPAISWSSGKKEVGKQGDQLCPPGALSLLHWGLEFSGSEH